MSTKTLLLEDERATRSWFKARLGECARMHLVASCGTLAAARPAIAIFAPELLILDLDLPDGSKIELIPLRSAQSLRGSLSGLETSVPRDADRL